MPQGCPSKSRDKSTEFQQQIVPGSHDEIMLLEGSEGKCQGTPGVRSASANSTRVKLCSLQRCRLSVWCWMSHWRVAHCRSASAWLLWKPVQVRCWEKLRDLSVFYDVQIILPLFFVWQGLWGIKSFMLKTELWGHSSLLLWYSNNWGNPKFGPLFVEKEQIVDIAALTQPLCLR